MKFGTNQGAEGQSSESNESNEQNVGGESGGYKQVDQAATTLADNADSSNNSTATNEPGKGAAPSDEGTTGEHPDNGPKATQERLDQSADMKPIEGKGYNPPADLAPTAKDLGVNPDANRDSLSKAFAEQAAAAVGVSSDSNEVVYSSHPIQQLFVGPYHFEKTILKLTPEQAADFDKLLESMPLTERKNIQKVSVDRVSDIVAARFPNGTQGIDTSAGRAALEALSKSFPKVGTESIEERMTAFTTGPLDGNTEIPMNPFDADFNRSGE